MRSGPPRGGLCWRGRPTPFGCRLSHRGRKGGGDFKPSGSAGIPNGIDPLNRLAGIHTTAAADAFAHIPDHGGIAQIFGDRAVDWVEGVFTDAELFSQGLELALAVALAVETALGMVGQQQFQNSATGPANPFGVGEDIPALVHNVVAGGFQAAAPSVFYHADAAESPDGQVGVMAQGRDFNADFFGGFHDGGAGGHSDRDAVDLYSDHFVGINMHRYHHSFCC